MCFHNLPIEFDAHGRASLRSGRGSDPFALPPAAERDGRDRIASDAPSPNGHIRAFDLDPVTRIAGALSFHTVIDFARRRVMEARSEATLFRGYEVILQGRDPIDAIYISSRACGVCGGVHSTCAAMTLEMAFGAPPPPLAIISRNLGSGAELVYDHALQLFLLAGPDYSETVVRRTAPSLWARAERTEASYAGVHGLRTIADIMRELNPLSGALYREALDVTRVAREIASLMFGKYPHPSTLFPGGVGIAASPAIFNDVLGRIVRLLDYAKRAATVWDDLVEFFLDAVPEYQAVGRGQVNLLSVGLWDDPEVYDASYARCAEWGEARLVSPGIIIGGELRTTSLQAVNLGIEEFVDRSYYRQWSGDRIPTDPEGAPLSPFHPWNKQTIPDPGRRSWKERYSWGTAPRWDREPLETGPLARQWITSVSGKVVNEFIRPVPGGLEIDLPKGRLPPMTLRWRIPPWPNALERNRARAYHIAYCGMAAYTYLLQAFDYLRRGKTEMATPYTVPDHAVGVGLWEAGRGALTHHAVLEKGRLANYQIITPSTWMASPADPFGVPGPYEAAVLRTPLLEEFERPEDFTGIDLLRTIRSFDPCMPCTVHMEIGGRLLHRDATSCACGVEGL